MVPKNRRTYLLFVDIEVHDLKYKAIAGLIRSFLKTVCNTDFRQSLFHEILYRYQVLDDKSIENLGLPPFNSASVFETIKKVYTRSPLKIPSSPGQNVTKEENQEQGHSFIPCRAELANVVND